MDTPQRGQHLAGTAISRVEDSPVFSYISNLSPIEPVKSVHITHALNFSSPPSVFASPHLNPLKERKLPIRYLSLDSSATDFSSEDSNEKNLSYIIPNFLKLPESAIEEKANCNTECLLNEATVDLPEETQKLTPRSLEYDCGSPDHNTVPCFSSSADLDKVKVNLVVFGSSVKELEVKGNDKEEVAGCEWENLITDGDDSQLLFDPSIQSEIDGDCARKVNGEEINYSKSQRRVSECGITDWQKSQLRFDHLTESEVNGECSQKIIEEEATYLESQRRVSENDITDWQKSQPLCDPSTELEVNGECSQKVNGGKTNSFKSQQMGSENSITDLQKTQLIFDPSPQPEGNGEYLQNVNEEETNHPKYPLGVSENDITDWQKSQRPEQGCPDYQNKEAVDHEIFNYEDECDHHRGFRRRCLVFEMVGLKANSSASFPDTLKEISEDKHQSSSKPISGSNPQVLPGIGLHLNSLATSSKVRIATEDNSSGRKLLSLPCPNSGFRGNDNAISENDLQELTTISSDELEPSSPKKKKCKAESSGESGSCRRCNCKKSKCLKLYCECFAAGVYCVGPCACEGCLNKPVHEDIVLATRKQIESRNPLAFAPKVIRSSALASGTGEDINKTPASARHKRGCNCKKSGCLKKYCECYQGGVGCSVSCRCEGCKNTFGRREGTLPIVTEEPQLKEEHIDLGADIGVDFTPSFQNSRPPIGSPPLLTACHRIQKSVLQKSKLENHFQKSTPEDETPRILREMVSPLGGVKISSPNRKRVSPPHYDMSSPNRKGGRRLILRSIPSFPSLAIFPESDLPENDFNC